jgi:enoyl-CoA hydratase/carnithine racemase
VTRLELRRPDRLNALDASLIVTLHAALDAAAADRACRVIVLTGAGRGFSAGMDLRDFRERPGAAGLDGLQASLARQRQIASLISHLRAVPQPVIAALNGLAASRIGLVTDVVADDRLQDAVLGKAGEIIARSAFAVALTKEGMWAAVETRARMPPWCWRTASRRSGW